MSPVTSELAAIAFFMIVGWVALLPMRQRLGAYAYHIAAVPAGILAAPLAAAVTTLIGRPLDIWSALAGAVLLVAVVWGLQRLAPSSATAAGLKVGPWSYAIAAGAMGLFSTAVGLFRYTVANADSYVSYWPLAVELTRTGVVNIRVFASRGAMLPSMGAIHAMFGSEWAYVIYPVLAATLLGWIAMTLWTGPLSGASRKTKTLVAGGAVLFLVLEPSFLFHSFFVHSHMMSALYLLMSLSCLWMAVRPGSGREDGELETGYLILSGAFAAGFALTRTDGLAYVFVPIATAISVLTMSKVQWRRVAAFYAPLFFIVFTVFSAGYLNLGMWEDSKLSGRPALMILAVMAFSLAGPWIVEALDRVLPFRVSGERFIGILVCVSVGLMLAVFAWKWDSSRLALNNTRINLFEGYGGYHFLWYAVVVLIVLSFFTRDALRRGSWTRWAFLAIALYYPIAGLIHGTSHAGRIGTGDSLNRVVFHAVPLIVWYVAAVVARILGPVRSRTRRADPRARSCGIAPRTASESACTSGSRSMMCRSALVTLGDEPVRRRLSSAAGSWAE